LYYPLNRVKLATNGIFRQVSLISWAWTANQVYV